MSGTALEHPLVRDYLRDLDQALAVLPAGQAAELREQIAAHLDDALPPGADDQDITLALHQLGAPAELAAEAARPAPDLATVAGNAEAARPAADLATVAGDAGADRPAPGRGAETGADATAPPAPELGTPAGDAGADRRTPDRGPEAEAGASGHPATDPAATPAAQPPIWRRVSPGVWATFIGAAALAIAVAVYFGGISSTPPLRFGGDSSWWYMRDGNHQVDTQADGASQTAVPVRSLQEQGIAFVIVNPSDRTQTVLGPGPADAAPGNAVQYQISVSTTDPQGPGGDFRRLHYARQVSIPPHHFRWVKLMWISRVCLSRGASAGIDDLTLRVRVGWTTRDATIELGRGWFVNGPSHGPCN
jgi:HAAS domain-containing protein